MLAPVCGSTLVRLHRFFGDIFIDTQHGKSSGRAGHVLDRQSAEWALDSTERYKGSTSPKMVRNVLSHEAISFEFLRYIELADRVVTNVHPAILGQETSEELLKPAELPRCRTRLSLMGRCLACLHRYTELSCDGVEFSSQITWVQCMCTA